LYLILITNKGSNIVEDLDTIRLLSKVIPEQLGPSVGVSEESISSKVFEILFAVDEVIATGGYREDINLHTIRTNLEMESHEEKLAQMIKASKMAEAKEAAKRKAAEIRERTREEERTNKRTGGFGGGSGSSGYGGMGSDSYSSSSSSAPYYGGSSAASAAPEKTTQPVSKKGASGGMVLGGKKGPAARSSLAGLMAEEGIRDSSIDGGVSSAAAAIAAANEAAAAAAAHQVALSIEEKLIVRMTRDGGCESMEVKGLLTLTVQDENAGRVKVMLSLGEVASAFQFQTHPNVNKPLFTSDSILSMKQLDRAFPTNSPLGVLRWRYTDTDPSAVPFTINCWPEENGDGTITVNIEYTLQNENLALNNVSVVIPLGTTASPKIVAADGTFSHNTRENTLIWNIASVSSENPSGTLEFNIKGKNLDAFFPVTVTFTSSDLLCPIAVDNIVTVDESQPVRYGASRSLLVESYHIE
jgi:coatomer subunit delta